MDHAYQDFSIGGEALTSHDRPPRKFASGRLCQEPGCETHLSIYNDGNRCSLHRLDLTQYMRGSR